MMLISLFLCKFSSFPSAGILKSLTKVVFSKVKIFYTPNYQGNFIHFEVYMKETALQLILPQDIFLQGEVGHTKETLQQRGPTGALLVLIFAFNVLNGTFCMYYVSDLQLFLS